MVQGFRDESGKWKRRKFRERAGAEEIVALNSVELLNSDTRLREVVTTLSTDQVKEAEAAFNRLSELEREKGAYRESTRLGLRWRGALLIRHKERSSSCMRS